MITIDKFRENLGNIVRPNRFVVTITPPSILDHSVDREILAFHSKSANIPARSIGEFEVKFYGQSIKLPGDSSYEDLTVNLINEEGWEIRDLFEGWQDIFLNKTDADRTEMVDAISDSKVRVDQYGLGDKIIASYEFLYVFPKQVASIELSHDTGDSIEEFQVTFAYSYWRRV